ncbi:MAG: amidohydrolase [SAR202 cluster bacterium]|nr:amidohydrolase [SAR202 cluster bacterium]
MDLVLVGGNILTVDKRNRRVQALAVEGGKVKAVGTSAQVAKMAGPKTKVVNLMGRTVTPGFIDPHNHFAMTCLEPVAVDCHMPPLRSIAEVLDAIVAAASAAPRGKWIMGLGFEWLTWGNKRRITRQELDEAAPNNPVCIVDHYWHAVYANSAALKLAGIERNTPNPPTGWVLKDTKGEPDGTLFERAMNPVHKQAMRGLIDHYGEEVVGDLVERNCMRHLSLGITGIGDALVMPESAEMYRLADKQKKLPIVVHQMRGGDAFYAPPEKASKGAYADDNVSDRLRGNIMKIFMDPVYPSNADVRHFPDGHTEHFGNRHYTQEEVDPLVENAHKRGIQVAIHCIGEWSIEQTLDTFEKAARKHPRSDIRFRLEHFTYPSKAQIKRAKSLGVIISHQPAFLATLGEYFSLHNKDTRTDADEYPVAEMLAEGIPMACGSDFPCAPLDPKLGLYALVSRKRLSDGQPVAPQQAIGAMDGIRMYTMGSAFAQFRENEVGSLEVGKRADMVVWSHDPTAVDPAHLLDIQVQQTYVDGKLLYQR